MKVTLNNKKYDIPEETESLREKFTVQNYCDQCGKIYKNLFVRTLEMKIFEKILCILLFIGLFCAGMGYIIYGMIRMMQGVNL